MKTELENAAEQEIKQTESKKSLGTIESKNEKIHSEIKSMAADVGYKKIVIDLLPTRGLFYPVGTEIVIRAAKVKEIRHWSTLDEDTDDFTVDDLLNFIMEECVKVQLPGNRGHFKDLKELDRFYIILAVRELTFKDGENKLLAEIVDPTDGTKEKVEVTKDIIKIFEPTEKLMKFYNEEKRIFSFPVSKNKDFQMTIPSLGVTSFLKEYGSLKNQKGEQIDRDFIKYAPFIIQEWRGVTEKEYEQELLKSYDWSLTEISVVSDVYDLFKEAVNPVMKAVLSGGREVTAPISFLGGLKAVFTIPNILDKLD